MKIYYMVYLFYCLIKKTFHFYCITKIQRRVDIMYTLFTKVLWHLLYNNNYINVIFIKRTTASSREKRKGIGMRMP